MFTSIQPYITRDEPFGPIDSLDIESNDVKAMNLLFEKHNWIYKNLRNRPSIIMGRRGAGKTHYLRSVYFEKQYDYYIEIRTPRVLSHVTQVVQRMTHDAVFTESVAELWEMILWISVFGELRKRAIFNWKELSIINGYLESIGVEEEEHVDRVLWNLSKRLNTQAKNNSSIMVAELLRGVDEVRFEDAKQVVIDTLERTNKKFVILMDSLEDFQLDFESVSRSLQGLLKLVGSMNKPRDRVDIRFCLPTEIYQRFIKISSNANKDFKRALKLQWSASELVLIGAHRLTMYLTLFYENFVRNIFPLDVTKRADAMKLFHAVLPEKITNGSGFQEETISYILRHTQLLPRHFLMLLNSIFKSPGGTQNLQPFPISQERIISGIRQIEGYIVSEIFVAFKLIYPTAEETCKRCLPELGHKFTMGDLHRVFTRHGKAVFGSDSLQDFQRMLLEIGAIGRVISDKESDIYIQGNFEYTVAHELVLSQEDELCVHPLFSGIFGGEKKDKPVYPYGSVLDDVDYRDNG
jgi:translation initiation factor 1 (eIF-1/SUI1)